MVTCVVAQERVNMPSVGDHEVGPAEDTRLASDDLELVGGGRRRSATARVTERLSKRLLNTVYRLLKRKQWGGRRSQ